jgi:uncharacterized protein DUF5753
MKVSPGFTILTSDPDNLRAHVAVGGPFTILQFSEPELSDIVYLEQLTSALYLGTCQDVQHYLMLMDRLRVQAKSPAETTRFPSSAFKEI